jgi:hypothetical protein
VILNGRRGSSGIGVGRVVLDDSSGGDVFPTSSISMPSTPLGPNVRSIFPLSSEGFHLTSPPDQEMTPDDEDSEADSEDVIDANVTLQDPNNATPQDPNNATPQNPNEFIIEDAKRRQKTYAEYKGRMERYLHRLGTWCGAYGILYLRSYDQSSAKLTKVPSINLSTSTQASRNAYGLHTKSNTSPSFPTWSLTSSKTT